MNRRLARELCMKMLYQMSIKKEYDIELIEDDVFDDGLIGNQKEYIEDALNKIIENINEIDSYIEKYAKGWKINRIAKVDLAILRLAIGEIAYVKDIPYKVSINEAIEIAKLYAGDDSPSFINAILDSYVDKEIGKDKELQE